MKKLTALYLLLLTSLSFNSFSQNPGWILPDKYIPDMNNSGIQPLPTVSPSVEGYHGDPATCASNMQMDADGNMLFFIVDGEIYDKEGYKIGDLTDASNSIYKLKGTSEIAIVPVPNNCSQYYIFLAGYNFPYISSPVHSFIAKIDITLPTDISANSGRLGRIVYCKDLQDYIPNNTPDMSDPQRTSSVFFSASKLRSDNTRFVFVMGVTGLYRFKLSGNNVQFDNFWSFVPKYFNHKSNGEKRGEMELIEFTGQQDTKYRLAISLKMNKQSSTSQAESVLCLDLNTAGNVIKDTLLSYTHHLNLPNNEIHPLIHGIEFSPDGNNLFITHCTNQFYPNAFDYFNFNNPSAGIQPVSGVSQNQASNFQYSQIEIGKSGNNMLLYLAYSGGLAAFSNPNNPTLGSLNMNAVPFSYNYNMQGVNFYSDGLKSYMLPDQIDGMDYQSIASTIYSMSTYTAQSSATWQPNGTNPWGITNMEVYITDKLIIPNNVNITIKNMTFHFAPDAKVIIEPGGKLTLETGSVLTNNKLDCDDSEGDFWQGVEVWGTSSQHQYPSQNPSYQGMLVLKNGGTIEYAKLGAQNWKPDDYNKIGGVIQSNGGKFINNRRDVGFISYQNFVPGNPSNKQSDLSVFNDTEFISDDNYIEITGDVSSIHVTMWDVHGIQFNGCTFANNKTGTKWNSASPNKGIYSVDASFTVGTFCTSSSNPCPSGSLQKSSFSGLFTAIEADGAGTSETVKVTQSNFTDIVNGILINEIDNVSIDRNNMFLNDPGYNQNPYFSMQYKGVQIKNATGFLVEENDISSTTPFFFPNAPYSYGIVINNSGTANNRVYKNDLSSLRVASSAYAINYEPTTAGDPSGLQFLCNNYSNNMFDIYVGNIANVNDGIRLFQGNYNYSQNARIPAGNKFSSGNPFSATWNLDNHHGTQINYYYNPNVANTEPINSNGNYDQITKAITTSTNSCPSSFGGGGIIFLPFSSLSGENDSLENVYNNLNYNYRSLIDGGNTQQLQQAIDNSWSDDTWALRNQLIEKSPYLSTGTLLKVAEQQDLPDAMLLEILLANPDATHSPDFIEKLKEATHYTFPQYMIDYVKDNRNTETTRTNLEGQMGGIQTQIALNQSVLKHRSKMRDSFDLAERQSTVEIGNSIFDKVGRADYYISQKQWTNAKNVINDIKTNDSLKEQLDFIQHFSDYINFRENLGDREISQLDTSEIDQLKHWADGSSRVAGYAQNILCFFYNTCYSDSLTVDESGASTSSSNVTNTTSINDVLYNLAISPNPATSSTSVQWTIYDELENCSYKVQNLNDGSVVAQGNITQNEGSVTLNVNSFLNGYYVVKIINKGKVKADKKLVVE